MTCLFLLLPLSVGAQPVQTEALDAERWLAAVLDASENSDTYSDNPWPVLRTLGVTSIARSLCWKEFRLAEPHPAVLVGVSGFTLGPSDDCERQHLGVLNLIVDDAILSADAMARRITDRLGIAPTRAVEGPNLTLHWQRSPTDALQVSVSSDPRDAGTVELTLARADKAPPGHRARPP